MARLAVAARWGIGWILFLFTFREWWWWLYWIVGRHAFVTRRSSATISPKRHGISTHGSYSGPYPSGESITGLAGLEFMGEFVEESREARRGPHRALCSPGWTALWNRVSRSMGASTRCREAATQIRTDLEAETTVPDKGTATIVYICYKQSLGDCKIS
jgi:hypothetical protein